MRTRFYVGLLLGLGIAAGCDNVTAGQPTDSASPPQLTHVLVQDARYLISWPNRASSLDLLDNNATRTCYISCKGNCPADPVSHKAPAQLDTCINEFLVDQVAPNVACTAAGTCADPFKVPSTGIPIPLSADLLTGADDNRDPGGGIQIRFVFDKVLDSSIEAVTMDPSKAPGATNTYTLMAGILELDDEAGMPVKSAMYIDNGGSPSYSADLELVPLGPALVIKPKTYLDPSSTYTVKILNPGALKDREGNAATGLGGGAIPTSFKFTTEDLTASSDGVFGIGPLDYPDFSSGPTIAPNEVIQITFFGNIAGDTAVLTVTSGDPAAKPIVFSERGADPTACPTAASGDPSGFILDVANTDTGSITTGMPVDWPAGDYTITIAVKDINGKTTHTADYSFTVGGTDEMDPMVDPNIAAAHLVPSQCTQ